MPNHVLNKVTFKNTNIEKQKKILIENINSKNEIDFNFLIPVPESLHIESSTYTSIGLVLENKNKLPINEHITYDQAQAFFKKYDKDIQEKILYLGKIALSNLKKYKATTWYDFNKKNWGTKWNAYQTCIDNIDYSDINSKEDLIKKIEKLDNISFSFQTAWSSPFQWFDKFFKTYNDLDFKLEYADENIGSNCGIVEISNGQVINNENEDHFERTKWIEFGFYLWNGKDSIPEEHGYNKDWEYCEETEINYEKKQKIKNKLENFD